MNGVRGIRSEKLRKHQHTEGYTCCPENKREEWDEDENVE